MLQEDKDVLLKMLQDAKTVLDMNKTTFWLDCGTLLGVIRDKGFIPWEKDIDLGCWKSRNDYEIKQKLKKEFQKLGYEVFITDYWLNIHFQEYPKINLDVNFYTIKNNMATAPGNILFHFLNNILARTANHLIGFLYSKKFIIKKFKLPVKIIFYLILCVFRFFPPNLKEKFLNLLIIIRKKISRNKSWVINKFYFDNLKQISVFDGSYLIPEKSEDYLKVRYGSDWNVPKKQWDVFDDRTVI